MSEKSKRNILILLNGLYPLLVIGYILLSNGKILTEFIPRWNDEVCWWQQANAVSRYGRPLGYWGYNGGKPAVGTFAAWGPAAVLPYGLFGSIFGWNFYSYIYANIAFMSLAIFLFICLTDMDWKKLSALLAVNILQIVRNYYLSTAMAETARYSMGILAAGMIYWLFRHENCNKFVKYILIPVYLLYISQAYLCLVLCVFGYMYCILKNCSIWKRIWGGIAATALCVVFSYKSLLLLSTPYADGRTCNAVERVFENFSGLVRLLVWTDGESVFFRMFVWSYLVLLFVILILLYVKRDTMETFDKTIYGAAAFILMSFLGGYIVFYNTTSWTFIRGISIGLLMATFLLCLSEIRVGVLCFIICAVLTLPCLNEIRPVFINDRFSTEEWREDYNSLKKEFEKYIFVDSENDNPWNNTIGVIGTDQAVMDAILALPAGISVNAAMDGQILREPAYMLIRKKLDAGYYFMCQEYYSAGYRNIFENDDYMLMTRLYSHRQD